MVLVSVLVAAAMGEQHADLLDNLFTEGNNQFTAKMLFEVVKNNPGKSVVMSAFSVLTPLAQLILASDGASHDELLKAIGLSNDNDTRDVFSSLDDKLQLVRGIELKTASKIYIPKKSDLNPEFSDVIREVFKSEVKNVDFSKSTETANEINSWVEDQTNKRIKDLVSASDLSSATRSVLVNAIYFKGHWNKPFNKKNTKDEDFHVSKDKTIKVPMMHIHSFYNYFDSVELNAQVLELPFSGHDASFIAILPKEVDGLDALVEKLKDPSALKLATSQIHNFFVNVSLPKFKIETKTDLGDVLVKMGVKRVFDPQQAQINRLLKGEEHLCVSKAVQKAFIEVNEEGAEAAAANDMIGQDLGSVIVDQLEHKFIYICCPGQSFDKIINNFVQNKLNN